MLANSVDLDEMLFYVAYNLGLHCWPKYWTCFGVSVPQNVKRACELIRTNRVVHLKSVIFSSPELWAYGERLISSDVHSCPSVNNLLELVPC